MIESKLYFLVTMPKVGKHFWNIKMAENDKILLSTQGYYESFMFNKINQEDYIPTFIQWSIDHFTI